MSHRTKIVVGVVAIAVLAVGGLLAVIAVGGDDNDTATSAGYCAVAAERVTITEVLDPFTIDVSDADGLRETLETAKASLDEAAAAAPSEIADDYDVIVGAFAEVFALFEETDFDFEKLAATFDADELAARIDAEEVSDAEQAIAEFEAEECVSSTTTTPAASLSDVAASIRDTFSDEELQIAFDFVGVTTVEELAAAILDGKVSLNDLDAAMRTGIEQPYDFGDSPELDVLWTTCSDGDLQSCDALYAAAPLNSAYQRFGASCGERTTDPIAGRCESDL